MPRSPFLGGGMPPEPLHHFPSHRRRAMIPYRLPMPAGTFWLVAIGARKHDRKNQATLTSGRSGDSKTPRHFSRCCWVRPAVHAPTSSPGVRAVSLARRQILPGAPVCPSRSTPPNDPSRRVTLCLSYPSPSPSYATASSTSFAVLGISQGTTIQYGA